MSPAHADLAVSPALDARVIDVMLDGERVSTTQKAVFLFVFFGILFDVFEQNAVGIVAPMLRTAWHLDGLRIGFLNTVTFFSAAVGKLASGMIADRWGRRVAFNLNLALYALGGAVCAVAPDYPWFCLGRLVVGLGLGGEIVTGLTLLSEFFPPGRRRAVIGLTNLGAGGFGNMAAPSVGMLVFFLFPSTSGWRWLFAVLIAPICVIALLRRRIPETPFFLLERGRLDELEHVMFRLTGRSVRDELWRARSGIGQESVGTAIVPDRGLSAMMPRLLLFSLLVGLAYGVQISALTMMPILFETGGRTAAQALFLVSLCQVGGIAGALAASVLARRHAQSHVLIAGSLGGALVVLLLAATMTLPVLPALFGFLFYFAVILINTTLWIMIPETLPVGNRGKGTAIVLAAGNVVGAIVPSVAGFLFDRNSHGAVLVLSAFLYLLLAASAGFALRADALSSSASS